jgi:hypothetical protein
MAATRFPDDVEIAGSLRVSGSLLPARARGELAQDNEVQIPISFAALRIWDAFATPISAAASDDLGISSGGTYGTNAPYITAGDLKAAGATTRRARFLYTLPPEYVSGETVRIVAHAGMITTAADVSCTLDFEAYELNKLGAVTGSDLVTTAATSINSTTVAAKTFEVNAAGLAAGDVLDVRVSIACNDGATATAVIPAITHLVMAIDIKG